MGLNAYFTYGVVLGMGFSWQVALGAVFISGVLFLLLSIFRTREWIINAVPKSLKLSVSAGIGMFLAIIALKNAGIVQDHQATLVTVGDLTAAPALLAASGFIVIIVLNFRKVPGAIIIGIILATAVGIAFGVSPFNGVVATPPSMAPTFLQLDLAGAFQIGLVTIVFAFLFVDLFDTAGTLIGIAHRAGFLDEQGRLPRIRKALIADSVATMAGAAIGTSTTTSYIGERRWRERRRAYGFDGSHGRSSLYRGHRVFAASYDDPRVRHGARPALCCLHHGQRAGGDRLGRRDGVRARGSHGLCHAVHVFNCHWDRDSASSHTRRLRY